MQALIDRIKQRKDRTMEQKVQVKPRNALVKIKKIDSGERRTDGGIWLPKGNLGMMFEVAQVLDHGPGILLDNGEFKGCDDLEIGGYVLVKTGERRARGGRDIQGQEVRSCLDLDLGDDTFIIIHQNDIIANLPGYVPPAPQEPAVKAEQKTTTPKLVLTGDSGNQGTQHDAADDVN